MFVTLAVNVAAGVTIFFFMLLGMNGFSESDANYGFGTFIALSVLVSLTMSVGAALAVHLLMKRKFKPAVAALAAIQTFSILGAGLKIVCSIIGLMIADYVRVNY